MATDVTFTADEAVLILEDEHGFTPAYAAGLLDTARAYTDDDITRIAADQ
jgi:hypothetical protein